LHIEYNIESSDSGTKKINRILRKNTDRFFEFAKPKALENIGWFEYDLDKFDLIKKTTNVDSLALVLTKESMVDLGRIDRIEYRMHAHLLFNRGILTTYNSCLTNGNLYYTDRNKIHDLP